MHFMTLQDIRDYRTYLFEQERSAATLEKYIRNLERFFSWLPEGKAVTKAAVIAYKQSLGADHAPAGVNAILAALNGFFRFREWGDCAVKPLHIQRRVFSNQERELSRAEYVRLVETARAQDNTRLALLLQLMASTGIRVSEIRYVTAEALVQGRVEIHLKGKIRTVLLPSGLCKKLRFYQKENKIRSGPIFLAKDGRPLDRRFIWAQMKRLCRLAGVDAQKVFPHNLRHLFARSFYQAQRDVVKLADLLGHSSIETTRIYLLTSGQEHQQVLDSLRLIC